MPRTKYKQYIYTKNIWYKFSWNNPHNYLNIFSTFKIVGNNGMASSGENDLKKTENVNASAVQSKPDRRLSISSKRPENAEQKNFRSQYYKKVGFHGVDERKTLELLLNEDPINLNKLKNFALQFSIPSFDRILVWKFMLGKNLWQVKNLKENQ